MTASAAFACHTVIPLLVSSGPQHLLSQRGKYSIFGGADLPAFSVVTSSWIYKQSQKQLRKSTVKVPAAMVY